MFIFSLLLAFNFVWLGYLTFIIYYRRQGSKHPPVSGVATNMPQITQLLNLSQKSFKKSALVRFNPFDDIGGDQSFILVMLDSQDSGYLLTSLHTRDNTRIYAKLIKNGQGQDNQLSPEEKSAVLKAIKS
jgi:hypothetical protein